MKTMKKLASLLLVLMLVLSLTATAFAAADGSITVTGAINGHTYSIYRIFDLSYNATNDAYAYTVNSSWESFINQDTIKGVYVNIDAQGYVTWVENADAAAFAKDALDYAKATTTAISAIKTETAANGTVEFSALELGYYLLDSSLGSLCGLTTTKPTATVEEKNAEPTIDKNVKEGDAFGKESTSKIGDIVTFQTTVTAMEGAQNYVVHDKMSEGLTYQSVSSVKVNGTELDSSYYSIATTGICADCDFHITFTKEYLDTVTDNTKIVIEYTAILNEKAVISTNANTNNTKLNYGDSSETSWVETKTYTFQFDLIKTDSSNKVLDGATFELYDAQTGGNKINLVNEADGTYRVATSAETTATGFKSAIIATVNGQAVVKGLDANTTYYLEEVGAPSGYNKLATRQAVTIADSNLTGTVTDGVWTEGGVHVINNTGSELPSTGGIGTTIFYIVGGILMLGALVLLVTKRRMNTAE